MSKYGLENFSWELNELKVVEKQERFDSLELSFTFFDLKDPRTEKYLRYAYARIVPLKTGINILRLIVTPEIEHDHRIGFKKCFTNRMGFFIDFLNRGAFVISREKEYLQFSDRAVFRSRREYTEESVPVFQHVLCLDKLKLVVLLEISKGKEELTLFVWNT